jgi:hypothetical protein
MTLLAEKGWLLIRNPKTLVAKVFRETNGGFLEANLGNKPSYA